MTQHEFSLAVGDFERREPMRAQLYYRALKLIEGGFRTEAHLLILATWNFARFRYVTKTFDLGAYEGTLTNLSQTLSALNRDLMGCPLAEHQHIIVQSFDPTGLNRRSSVHRGGEGPSSNVPAVLRNVGPLHKRPVPQTPLSESRHREVRILAVSQIRMQRRWLL